MVGRSIGLRCDGLSSVRIASLTPQIREFGGPKSKPAIRIPDKSPLSTPQILYDNPKPLEPEASLRFRLLRLDRSRSGNNSESCNTLSPKP